MSKFIRRQKSLPNKSPKKDKLSPNEKIFADRWLIDRNGTKSYKVAYPHITLDNTAAVSSFMLLRKPRVAKYIQKKLDDISEKAGITIEWILERYKRLIECSVDDFFDDNGDIKPLSEIPKDKLYAVCGFKANKVTFTEKDSQQIKKTIIREFKFGDKKGVLDSLAKYLGMFEKDNEQKNKLPLEINVNLVD